MLCSVEREGDASRGSVILLPSSHPTPPLELGSSPSTSCASEVEPIQCLFLRLYLAFAGSQITGCPCCNAPGRKKVYVDPGRVSIGCPLYSWAAMSLRNGWDKSCHHCGEMSWRWDRLEVLPCDLDSACICSDVVWRRESTQLNCIKTSRILKSPVILI